jgi:acetylglutamate kinase
MPTTNKPLVIKIGGAILEQPVALNALLSVLKNLTEQSPNKQTIVLVHGGGCVVDEMLSQAGFTSTKKHGLRVTPREQMPIISGALAGNVNKGIVAKANSLQLNAVGLSLIDGNMVNCQLNEQGLGAVGEPSPKSSALLDSLLQNNFMPVICSIGALANGELVNVNADDAAVAICQLLNAELLLLTDVDGVWDAQGQCLSSLNTSQANALINQGVIAGGMTAKVNAALNAAHHLRRSIAVASWKTPEKIVQLLAGDHIGTRILPN